jgi:hypothetical protein
MTVRDLLIRAYPRSWRDEFGPEFAGILANEKLKPVVIADVLLSAAIQHLRRDLWKICGLSLTLWTAGLMITASKGLMNRPALVMCYFAGQLFLFAAGAWTGLRESCGLCRAMAASAKAALLPAAAFIVVSSLKMLRSLEHYHVAYGHKFYFEIWKTAVVTILVSLLFGLAGALCARLVGSFRTAASSTS